MTTTLSVSKHEWEAASPKAHRTYSLEDDRQLQEARRAEVAPPQPKTEEDRP